MVDGPAAGLDLLQHAAPPLVEHGGAIDHELVDQFFLRAEVIVQRGVVALARRGDDLLHGYRVDAVTGEQHLRRRLDLALGIFKCCAGRRP